MANRIMKEGDALEDFTHREITLDGVTKMVHVAGAGSIAIIMTEWSQMHRTAPLAFTEARFRS